MQVLFKSIKVFYMIKSNLPVLLAERRLKVADLIRMTDISKSTMHKIYNDQTTRIDFETIDKICEALDVQVGDLFQYKPNKTGS
jgi:putative transcriptional regulator